MESEQDSVVPLVVPFVVAIEHVIEDAASFLMTVNTMVSATIGLDALLAIAFTVRLRTVQAAVAGRNAS